MFLTKIGSHKKNWLSSASYKKVMKKRLGGGINLPHPNWNRVKVHGDIRKNDGTKYQTLFHPDVINMIFEKYLCK